MLAVLTNRLARVVDRSRGLETQLPATAPEGVAGIHDQLHTMARRAKLISHGDDCALHGAAVVPAGDLHRDGQPADQPAMRGRERIS
jgi:hypothetical protein